MGEMVNTGGHRVVNWIWRLCNMVFEIFVVLEDLGSSMIVPLYKGKGKERNLSVRTIEVLAC